MSRADDSTIAWLLEGDPVIRRQTLRDLLDEPAEIWETERRRVTRESTLRALRILRAAQA